MPARTPLVPNRKALGLESEIPDRKREEWIDGHEAPVLSEADLAAENVKKESVGFCPVHRVRGRKEEN
jgi:hypothetical protein